jgi:transposase-like protein
METSMGQGVKRTQRDDSLTFKLALVEQIENGELTYQQAQTRYGIQGNSTILVWLRKHGRQGWCQGASVRADRSTIMPDPNNQPPSSNWCS